MPAAAVIPALIAYINVVAVKKLVVGFWANLAGPTFFFLHTSKMWKKGEWLFAGFPRGLIFFNQEGGGGDKTLSFFFWLRSQFSKVSLLPFF